MAVFPLQYELSNVFLLHQFLIQSLYQVYLTGKVIGWVTAEETRKAGACHVQLHRLSLIVWKIPLNIKTSDSEQPKHMTNTDYTYKMW